MRRDGLRQRLAHDLRWRVGLLVFAVLGAVGSACAAWALHDMRLRSAHAASQDAGAMAQSVAQNLAQQLSRAVRLGIPLRELPGVPAYLQGALDRQPTLVRIAVEAPDGQVLHAVGGRAAARGDVQSLRVPITAGGVEAGAVALGVDAGAGPQRSLRRAAWESALAVLVLALACALAVAFGPAAGWEMQRRRVQARLAAGAEHAPTPGEDGASDARGPAAVARALHRGDERLLAARKALQAYGEELLALDFDGHLRTQVEHLVRLGGAAREAGAPPQGDNT